MRRTAKVLPPRDNHYYIFVHMIPDTSPVAILHSAAGSLHCQTQGPSNFSHARTLIYSLPDSTSLSCPDIQASNERAGLEISIRWSSANMVAETVKSSTIYHLFTSYYLSGGVLK